MNTDVQLMVHFQVRFSGNNPEEIAEFKAAMAAIVKGGEWSDLPIAGYLTDGLHTGLLDNLTFGMEGATAVSFKDFEIKEVGLETEQT